MKKNIFKRLVTLFLAVVLTMGLFAPMLTTEVEAASYEAWVGYCPYDRQIRNENGQKIGVKIPAGFEFIVIGVKKNDSTRYEVLFGPHKGNIDRSNVKEAKGTYIGYNTADRRIRDAYGGSLELIPAGSYFPCRGKTEFEPGRLLVVWATCEGSIAETCVKKVTEVKVGTSSTGSTGTGSAGGNNTGSTGGNNTGSTSTSDKGSTGSGSTKEPSTKGAWVGECPYDRRMRDANGNRMEVLIPANADFVVRGVKKDDSTRLEVWYEGNYGNIDKSGVKEVKGAYVAYNTAGRRMRDKNGASLDMIPAGSYFPCYGTSKNDSTRLDAAFGTCKGSILGTSVKKVTEVKAGKSSTGSSGTSDKMPSTKGKTGYLVVNKNDFSIYMCYGKVEGDSTKVWVDTNFDGKIDKKVPSKAVQKVDSKSTVVSVTDQKLYVLRNNKCVYKTDCVTGKYNTRWETTRGIHRILERKNGTWMRGENSKGEPYATWSNHYNEFTSDGQAIHDNNTRPLDTFGGDTYKNSGSLGCVNLSPKAAKKYFEEYSFLGEQVIVTDSSLKGLK